MAFARLAFRVLFILLLLFVAIGLLLPSSAQVERSLLIEAPPERIFPHLNSMRAFHAWSPWSALDPDTRYDFEGPQQGVGSRMSWQSGTSEAGQGSQQITVSEPYRRVEMQMDFGGKGNGRATFLLDAENGSTRVHWQFRTRFGWDLFGRYVGLMLDSMVGAAYDKGLRTLKAQVEAPPAGVP